MTIYGEQENKTSRTDIMERWGRILEVIYSVFARGESLIIMADLNRHIGSDHLGVSGNHDKISYGGSLVRDLIDTGDVILVNNTEKVEGGPFTRKDPSFPNDEKKKSCLDLVLISKDLYRCVEKLFIDKNERLEMGRVAVKNGVKGLVKPDHYTMVLSLHNIPLNRNKINYDTDVRFNLKKPEGWKMYQTLTEDCKDLLKIVSDDNESMKNVYSRFEKIHTKNKI